MTDKQLAQKLLDEVGGESNIKSVAHCVTRLRFKLKDESIANDDVIQKIEEVQGLVKKGGQYQIVLGPSFVNRIYDEVLAITNLDGKVLDINEDENNGSLFDRFIDVISGVFTPVLGLLAASGIVKGLSVLLVTFGLVTTDSTTYSIINGIGDSFFAAMPIFLGYYSMKKFGGTPMLGAAIGATLVYPAITALAGAESSYVLFENTVFASQVKASYLGLPLILPTGGYGSSVLPIIAINFFSAKLEKYMRKITPDFVALFLVPMTVLLVMSSLGLLIIGPVLSVASSLLSAGFLAIRGISPILYGAVLAGTWQLLVMFGLHWAVIPMAFLEFAQLQAGEVSKMHSLIATDVVSFAAIGAVLAIFFKTRDKKLKQVSLPAFITGIFGITEPALYGVTLPRKKIFAITCVASAIGGAVVGLLNIGKFNMAGLGIFTLPGYLNPNAGSFAEQTDFIIMVATMAGTFALSFALTYIFGFNDKKEENSQFIAAPVNGKLVAVEELDDAVFSSKTMGETIAIEPTSNEVVSPVNGEITAIFPTKHAIGITSDQGVEILIHIGIDTVELNGEHFDLHVSVGEKVVAGQALVTVDFAEIAKKDYKTAVILVVTNSATHPCSVEADIEQVTISDNIIKMEA